MLRLTALHEGVTLVRLLRPVRRINSSCRRDEFVVRRHALPKHRKMNCSAAIARRTAAFGIERLLGEVERSMAKDATSPTAAAAWRDSNGRLREVGADHSGRRARRQIADAIWSDLGLRVWRRRSSCSLKRAAANAAETSFGQTQRLYRRIDDDHRCDRRNFLELMTFSGAPPALPACAELASSWRRFD